MTKRKDVSGPTQLEFDCIWGGLHAPTRVAQHTISCTGGEVANVVRFIDATTLAVRREAVDRVARAGIFAVPNSKR